MALSGMALSGLDYWRLADDLSVIDAAILITGNNPSERVECRSDMGDPLFDADGKVRTVQKRDYEGFDAVFKSLRFAIMSDKLRATVALRARDNTHSGQMYSLWGDSVPRYSGMDPECWVEESVHFDVLMRKVGGRMSVFSNHGVSALADATTLHVLKEPAWEETTVAVDDLKDWLVSRGVTPSFFFPKGIPEGFRDQNHPRYSPKLACAVAAWEAVEEARPNKSVKATLEDWIRSNAVRFGMVDKDGVASKTAIKETSVVANWDTDGGAVRTSVEVREPEKRHPEKIRNFAVVPKWP